MTIFSFLYFNITGSSPASSLKKRHEPVRLALKPATPAVAAAILGTMHCRNSKKYTVEIVKFNSKSIAQTLTQLGSTCSAIMKGMEELVASQIKNLI
jgi:hypothetical protein